MYPVILRGMVFFHETIGRYEHRPWMPGFPFTHSSPFGRWEIIKQTSQRKKRRNTSLLAAGIVVFRSLLFYLTQLLLGLDLTAFVITRISIVPKVKFFYGVNNLDKLMLLVGLPA
ncbi:hypothetical protein SAMN05421755_105718 [Nitrosomonas sp. Nm33]|nr:hypothetical protein SAMN05421755_105718 [Nitrosomonas sp. Nm33]